MKDADSRAPKKSSQAMAQKQKHTEQQAGARTSSFTVIPPCLSASWCNCAGQPANEEKLDAWLSSEVEGLRDVFVLAAPLRALAFSSEFMPVCARTLSTLTTCRGEHFCEGARP